MSSSKLACQERMILFHSLSFIVSRSLQCMSPCVISVMVCNAYFSQLLNAFVGKEGVAFTLRALNCRLFCHLATANDLIYMHDKNIFAITQFFEPL